MLASGPFENPMFDLLADYDRSVERNRARAKLLAHLISMPVQLDHLLLCNFRWLLDVAEHVLCFHCP